MSAIFQKEWRSLFRSLRGYLLVGAFVFLFGLFTTVYQFFYGLGDFEVVLTFLSVGVSLLLPLVVVPLFCRKDRGEQGLLLLLPLRRRDVVLGKYLFAVSVIAAMGGIFLLWALFLGYLTEVNLLASLGAILGFLLMAHVVLALCALLSVTLRTPAVAYSVSYAVLILLVILETMAGRMTGMLRRIMESVSLFGSFSAFGEGRMDLRAMLLYLSLSALFLLLFFKKTMGKKDEGVCRRRRIGTVAALCACAVLVNTVPFLLPAGAARLDMTVDRYYTVSEHNRDLLAALERDVTLTVVNADGSDRKLEAYLEALDGVSSRLTVRYAKAEKVTELLAAAGLTPDSTPAYTIVASSDKRTSYVGYVDLFYYENTNAEIVSFVNYYRYTGGVSPTSDSVVRMGMTEYSTYYNLLGSSTSYAAYFESLVRESVLFFQGDSLVSLIEYVATEMIPQEYILTGHGEIDPQNTLLYALLSSFGEEAYTPLDLTATAVIPDDAASVLILRPTIDYTETEITLLQSYLERGGTLTVITDASNLTATPALMRLLASYGMTASAETVREEITVQKEQTETDETEEATEEDGEQETVTEVVESDAVSVRVNVTHDVFASLAGEDELVPTISKGSSLTLTPPADGTVTLTSLLTTSEQAYLGDRKDTAAVHTLAAVAESENGARLVWLTGGESFGTTLADYTNGNLYAAYLVALTMKWTDLVYRPISEIGLGRQYDGSYLTVSSNVATGVGIVTILVLPALFIGIGIFYLKRRKRA